jgi:ribosomal protein S18 acetylase RimI-like enzyme
VTLSFRAAAPDDIPAVTALVQSAFRGDESRRGWTTEADLLDGQRVDEAMVRDIIDHMVLVEDEGEIVACCHLAPDGDGAYLGMLSVRPALQAGGIGRALMAEAERRAVAWGAAKMRMTVIGHRTELISWYERQGYERTGKTEPFPYGDARFGLPKVDDLEFAVLEKSLAVG